MAHQLTLQIKNSLPAIQAANESVSHWLTDLAAPTEIQYFANLAIEEFVTNSIKYGYDDDTEHVIEASLSLTGGTLVLTIVDDGRPFNPLKAPEPKFDVPAGEQPVGGLGIHLVRQLSDQMEYTREGNQNRVRLQKSVRRATSQ